MSDGPSEEGIIEQVLYAFLPSPHTTVIEENAGLLKNTINDLVALYEKEILDISLLQPHAPYMLRMLTAGIVEFRSGYE